MSSKLKLKSNNGGSVSLVVDDALTTDEEVIISKGFTGTYTTHDGKTVTVKDGQIVSIV